METEKLRLRFGRYVYNNWHTPNTYSPNYKKVPNKSGVYVIIGANYIKKTMEIVYAGSSLNLANRYKSHGIIYKLSRSGKYDHVVFVFKEIENAFYDTEISLIRRLLPPLNKLHYA